MSSDSEQASGASSYASDSDVEVRSVGPFSLCCSEAMAYNTQVGNTSTSKKRKSMDSSEKKALSVAKVKKFKSAVRVFKVRRCLN